MTTTTVIWKPTPSRTGGYRILRNRWIVAVVCCDRPDAAAAAHTTRQRHRGRTALVTGDRQAAEAECERRNEQIRRKERRPA